MIDFETIACPLCLGKDFSVVYAANFPPEINSEFLTTTYRSSSDQALFEQVVRCKHCRLVYLNPRLSAVSIVEAYASGDDAIFIQQDRMRIRTFIDALRELASAGYITLSAGTHVLDVGCAGGAFLRAAKKVGLKAIGVEPSKWLSKYAREEHGLDVRTGTLLAQSFTPASFDLITLWDVIEHLPNPAAELDHIYFLLKPEGALVVNYPDFGSLPAQMMGKKWPFLLSVHLTYYTRRTICRQLRAHGFRVVRMRRHWQTLELGYVLERAAHYFRIFGWIKRAVVALGLAQVPIKYWIGQTKVVAKKYVK